MITRWIVLIIVIFALLCWNILSRFSNKRQYSRRISELASQGFPVSLDDLKKTYILPEGVENAADVYMQAFASYQKPDERQEKYFSSKGHYTFPENTPHDFVETMSAFLEKNRKTCELLDQAGVIENCLWPRTINEPYFYNGYYSEIKDAVRLLKVRNLYLAERKRSDELFDSFRTMIALNQTLKKQAFLIDHLVGLALKNLTSESLNEALNRISFTDQQLAYLQNEFEEFQGVDDLCDAFVIDRICAIEFWNLSYREQSTAVVNPPSPIFRFLNFISGQIAEDEKLSLDHLERYIEASKLRLHDRPIAFRAIEREIDNLPFLSVHTQRSVNFAAVNNIDLRVLGSLRCAETALAIERYRLRYQSLPQSLEQLVPEFMADLPREPFDNEVLRYIRHDIGYTVYAIGEDGIDNGGFSEDQMKEKKGESEPAEFDWPFTVKF